MHVRRLSVCLFLPMSLICGIPFAQPAAVEIADFSTGDLSGWRSKSFKGQTEYGIRDGALCARADGSASGLYREVAVDLETTPVLEWSWKVEEGFHRRDERNKKGDDYPARVYVIFSGGIAFWRTRAINYVWASSQPEGAQWPNAFTENARMIAVESGAGRQGRWVRESRNVREDYRRLFGEAPDRADAVAIMTDTDNGGGVARACYKALRFTSPGGDLPPR